MARCHDQFSSCRLPMPMSSLKELRGARRSRLGCGAGWLRIASSLVSLSCCAVVHNVRAASPNEASSRQVTASEPSAQSDANGSILPDEDYVIGGMDRAFRLKLFYLLHAGEQAGLAPGITSAFRDDYRQSIANGLKAANDKSYHGGSSRGGYGHGLAADVVSMNGGSKEERAIETKRLWKWIDEHEKQFGVGRPYLNGDPAHLAPVDGREYAAHRTVSRHTRLAGKRHTRIAASSRHGVTTRAKSKAASRAATTRLSSRL